MIYDNDAPPEEIWRTGRVEFALRYPFSNGWTTVAGCAVLVFLTSVVISVSPFVFGLIAVTSPVLPSTAGVAVLASVAAAVAVPALAVVGYGYTVCRETAYGSLRVPSLGNIGVRALRGVGVVLVAAVVFAPVGFVTADVALFFGEVASDMDEQTAVAAVALVVAVGSLVFAYLVTAFLTVYAVTGSVLRTFLSGRVLRFAGSVFYVRAWLYQFVVVLALLVVGVMSVPTVIGLFFWLGYVPIALAAYWGRVYKEAMDAGVVEPEDTAV